MVRISLSFAIIEITNAPSLTHFNQTCDTTMQNVTSPLYDGSATISSNSEKLNWSATEYGNMLAAFYYGYSIGMLPTALLTQKVGFYPVLGLAGVLNGILTMLYPFAVQKSYNMGLFLNFITKYN